MDHLAYNGLPSLGCHGDGGEGVVQHCFYRSYCFQQASHFFAVVDVGVAAVFSVTSPTGFPILTWTPQMLNFLLHLRMWHCGYV